MINDVKKSAEQKMGKSVDALKADLGKVRTGRAHTGLLDHIHVDYYGSMMPLAQVANVTLADARTIGVQPWEKKMIPVIEKAIRDSDLGLNPAIWRWGLGNSTSRNRSTKRAAHPKGRRTGLNRRVQASRRLWTASLPMAPCDIMSSPRTMTGRIILWLATAPTAT